MESLIEIRTTQANVSHHDKPAQSGVSVELSASLSSNGIQLEPLDVSKDSLFSTFMSNYECWNNETNLLSTNNYDSPNFQAIVDLGESVVPSIYRIIKDGAHPIVYALDRIFPGYMTYKGNVTLKEICQAWITILEITGKV